MKASDAPVSTATIPRLMAVLADPDSSVKRVAEVVGSDAGLAARVLAVANSAAFGLSRTVTEINQAVALVGSNMCQTLAIAGACNLLDGRSGLPHARDHSVRVACAARVLATRSDMNKADAFAAGLLHDLGEILLWRQQPDEYAAAFATWDTPADQLRGERGLCGRDHALAAREQLAEWQLPGQVVDAVGDHHRPDLEHEDLSTLVVVSEEVAEVDAPWSERMAFFGVNEGDLHAVRDEVDEAATDLLGLLSA